MSAPDSIRGAEGHGTGSAAAADVSEGIPTGTSRDGVMPAPSRYAAPAPSAGRAGPRLSAKWIVAAVVLAVMVFGVTIVLQLGGFSGKGGPDVEVRGGGNAEHLNLRFFTTTMPPVPEGVDVKKPPPLDVEFRREGWADFWFENENAKPVVVGLLSTSCSCSGAQIFVLPSGSKPEPGNEATLEKTATAAPLVLGSDEGVPVGPNRVGWVRMQWSGETKKDGFSIQLWLNSRETGPFPKLETSVTFHDPFTVETLGSQGEIQAASLEQPYEIPVLCWSATRSEMQLKTETFGGREGALEPFVVGVPQRLDDKGYKEVARQFGLKKVPLSVYRIPVKLRGKTDDGQLTDAGPFRRRLEVNLDGFPHAQSVDLQGYIRGDVVVLGQPGNRVDFSSFAAKKGSPSRVLKLQSSAGVEKLEVDKARTADFLEVELTPDEQPGGVPTWRMKMWVKPGSVGGRFPRESPAELRDSAVYVRPARVKDARATRIPVEGSATSD
jgi:hypothetical protein